MPYDSIGAYTNVAGATTAVAGNVVQSATWDNIHTDIGTALTEVMQQLVSFISLRNALFMNGGMEVWQRGAGASASIAVGASTVAYTADRWYLATGANQASTVAATTGLSNGSQLAAVLGRNAGQTGVGAVVFAYPLDTDEIIRLRGNKVSFTALVKAGATWSPASGTLTCNLYVGTGAVGKRNATPYTGETTVLAIATNLTAGGATTTISGASSVVVPTNSTQAELQFVFTPVGTAGATDNITIDDVQLEAQLSASAWTPTNFDRIPFSLQFEACQRHYNKSFPYSIAPAQSAGTPNAVQLIAQVANTSVATNYPFPVRVRATAGVTTYNPSAANANWRNITSGADVTAAVDPNTTLNDASVVISGVSVSAAGQYLGIHITASAGI